MFDAQAIDAGLTAGSTAFAPLSAVRRGGAGVVARVGAAASAEMERRLLEIGFVEGARVRVLHEGLFGADPIAVMVDDTRIALRRREAADVLLALDGAAAAR